jgi:hypothetical protein
MKSSSINTKSCDEDEQVQKKWSLGNNLNPLVNHSW